MVASLADGDEAGDQQPHYEHQEDAAHVLQAELVGLLFLGLLSGWENERVRDYLVNERVRKVSEIFTRLS